MKTMGRGRIIQLMFSLFLLLLSALPLSATGPDRAEGTYSSVAGYERALQDHEAWLAEADRLMDELHALDVRMHTLINTIGSEDSRYRLIRERNSIRHLIVELTNARNRVYGRYLEEREAYQKVLLSPELNRASGY